MQRRKHITPAALPDTDLESLYILVDSLDELARSLDHRAMSADARYLLTDLQNELEDAMLERGLPLFSADSVADHMPMVDIVQDDEEDTAPVVVYVDHGPFNAPSELWENVIDNLFDESAPPADDTDDSEAAAS